MAKRSAKTLWREKAILDLVWESRHTGGVTAQVIADDTAQEGKKTGVSGRVLAATLWGMYRRGLIVSAWVPIGKRRGSRYVILPGPNSYKAQEHARLEQVSPPELPPTTPPPTSEDKAKQHYMDIAKEKLAELAKKGR